MRETMISARYGLDSALLSTLRQHHILYDRSETGEFFHLYTQMIAGRFFFEVVQRNHYHEFGAANAPIRLAAQTRSVVTTSVVQAQND